MFILNSPQMYKVFFNDSLLAFKLIKDNLLKINVGECVDIEGVGEFYVFLKEVLEGKYAEEIQFSLKMKNVLYDQIRKTFTDIPAAGGLVKNKKDEFLFIKRFGRWDLPKGKIEKNESPVNAAFREVEEECGVTGLKLIKPLPSTFHLYHSPYIEGDRNLVWKETHWFEMLYEGNDDPKPQEEEQIEEVKWFAKNDLEEVYQSTYRNLQELLNNYFA